MWMKRGIITTAPELPSPNGTIRRLPSPEKGGTVRHLFRIVLVGAIVVGGPLAPAHAARTVTRGYVAGQGAGSLCFIEGGLLAAFPSVGGSCFDVKTGETSVTASVEEPLGLDVAVTIGIDTDGDGDTELYSSGCGEAPALTIPAEIVQVFVFVGNAIPDLLPDDFAACGDAVSVTGVITASFS
jgi:hypothetical protein